MTNAEKDIIDTIKKSAIEAWKAEQPVELRLGKVTSTDPLKIKISDTITLTKEFVTLNGTVSEGDDVSVLRQQGGQKYLVLGNRTQTLTGTVTIGGVDGGAVGNQANALVSVAKSQLNNGGSTYQAFMRIGNGFWCAAFVSWCAAKAGISTSVITRSAAVIDHLNFAKRKGRFHYKGSYIPVKGDLVIWKQSGRSHIGIITSANSSRFYTIEGNNNNRVRAKDYSYGVRGLTGFYHPAYTDVTKTTSNKKESETDKG